MKTENLMDGCTGIQHVGIPTDCMGKTCTFYEELGFERAFETVIRGTQKVVFMKCGDVVLELYEGKCARAAGAVDHIAIDCMDVERAYRVAVERGYKVVSEGMETLPFWEHGVKFFIIEGPNCERIEIDQKLTE